VAVALREFRRLKKQMAVVKDNSTGLVLGIVTLEDVLEEIVGEIEDEHDQPRPTNNVPQKIQSRAS
jgi:CBS domain containing-hemolysin-like protein